MLINKNIDVVLVLSSFLLVFANSYGPVIGKLYVICIISLCLVVILRQGVELKDFLVLVDSKVYCFLFVVFFYF